MRHQLFRYLRYGILLGLAGGSLRYSYKFFTEKTEHKSSLELTKQIFTSQPKPIRDADSLYKIGENLFNDHRHLESIAYFKKVIELIGDKYINDDHLLIKCQYMIGRVYQEKEMKDEAEFVLKKALDSALSKKISDPILIADIYHHLGLTYELQDNYYSAEKSLLEALRLKESNIGENSISASTTHYSLCKLYNKYGDILNTTLHLNKTGEAFKNNLHNDEMSRKLRYLYLGEMLNVYRPLNLLPQMVEELRSLKNKFMKSAVVVDREAFSAFQYYAGLLEIVSGDRKEGFKYLRGSLESLKLFYGKTHPKVQRLYKELYGCYMSNFQDPKDLIYLMKE